MAFPYILMCFCKVGKTVMGLHIYKLGTEQYL